MRRFLLLGLVLVNCSQILAQDIKPALQTAFRQFENDDQLKYAISSLYVIDAKTGKVVFDKNSRTGLAPASTQKIITSISAFELLGKDFRYQTSFVLAGLRMNPQVKLLQIIGSGDPSFGSWRYQSTSDLNIIAKLTEQLQSQTVSRMEIINYHFGRNPVPDGYIWEDMGNYYGSGHFQLNWKENQYDIAFGTTSEGSPASISRMSMDSSGYHIINEVKAGPKGSGDNAYIYSAPFNKMIYMQGTVPPDQKAFTISGSNPDPALSFAAALSTALEKLNASFQKTQSPKIPVKYVYTPNESEANTIGDTIYQYLSPSLDSLVYWFNKKSINLYGEALLKSLAVKQSGFASTDSGVAVLKRFWKKNGIDAGELNMADGSGLSPLNRVTTHVQVEILKYAKNRDWYPDFFNALPEYNGMKMKSGTIHGVKGFCGYHQSKNGNEYIFSFLVNNYSGSASSLVNKMYKVLDVLK